MHTPGSHYDVYAMTELNMDFDTTPHELNCKEKTQSGTSKSSHTSNQIIAYYRRDICENRSDDHSETSSTGFTDPTISSRRHDATRRVPVEGFVGKVMPMATSMPSKGRLL